MKSKTVETITIKNILTTLILGSLITAISGCDSTIINPPAAHTDPIIDHPVIDHSADHQPIASHVDAPTSPKPREGKADDQASTPEGIKQVVTAGNQFAIDMYQKLNTQADQAGKNVFFSPYSLSTAVGMLYNAAEGESKNQMAKTFHYPSLNTLNPNSAALYNRFNQINPDYKLVTTNDLWLRQDLTAKPSYQDAVQRYFASAVKKLDFMKQPEQSRQTINQSIANQTNQMIPQLLPEGSIVPSTVSVLTNAIYFKGDWQSPFDSSYDADFYKFDGSKIKTKLMYQKGYFGYTEDKQAQVIALPYKGEALSMLVILPKSKDKAAMDRLIKGLTPTQIDQWSASLEKQEVILNLPKFTLNAGYEMKPLLSNLGMPRAFEKTGEFKMFGNDLDKELVVDNVYHKAVIKVDEVGSEAAAATAIVVVNSSAPMQPPVEFTANHPFMFVIKDNETGAILFLGQMNQP